MAVENAQIGVPYELDVGTHCGFAMTSINGDSWIPIRSTLPRQGNNVFDFHITRGTIVLSDRNHAMYTTATNFHIRLRRLHGPSPSFPLCD
jgi:hypothetical protein